MDDENVQVHVSNRGSVRQDAGKPAAEHGAGGKPKTIKNKHVAVIVGVIVVLALITFGLWNVYRTTTGAQIDSSKYQVVILSDGQHYFGKLSNLNGSYMKMTNVFYLQTRIQAQSGADNELQEGDNEPDVQLIKLGNEIHGPEDEMFISKDRIMQFENLKSDGRVVQAITEYYNNQN